MSTNVLAMGGTGTGKSYSMKNLDPSETFLIKVVNQPLPFAGGKQKYIKFTTANQNGNTITTDDSVIIARTMQHVSDNKPNVKTLLIDDMQYSMSNTFMRKHSSTGAGSAVFDLYNEIGDQAWNLFMLSMKLRDDLIVIFLSHSEESETGKTRFKSIGRMLDEKIVVEGLFTIVLETVFEDDKFHFITQNNGRNSAKSPENMFPEKIIDNDLQMVVDCINNY